MPSILDAQVVFIPLVQILSLIAIGTPAKGPVRVPDFIAAPVSQNADFQGF